eukprot:gnl/Dysnectes_brevis/1741_a1986_2576.p1 GENE.gnl/Dysnectes_brevis/1741_a1986_2576~~gnl/Dysnectes_brevis/1741_a1986_2576.p1  ORF type:complete len:427 (+),score=113.34 gnl/Dysnectes_brevis/1741_a1986_2576:38-1282(+)
MTSITAESIEEKHKTESSDQTAFSPGLSLSQYYRRRIYELKQLRDTKRQDVARLEAQRNALNTRVRKLNEEIMLLQEPPFSIGEVIKLMGQNKVYVKVHPDDKHIVPVSPKLDRSLLKAGTRVSLRSSSMEVNRILPTQIDPLVSLMKVEKVPNSSYDMVGGLEKQIQEIKEVVELPIKHPELFDALGIAQPKGLLLYGPPGTGKTLLARAVAYHTSATFIRVSGGELVQKYIGEGARMVRELFVMARQHAPSIIFIDEVDSIGGKRKSSKGGESEVQRTMLELLNQLDGFEPSANIKIIMATNRIDILDPALLRPGRIDRKIEFPPPESEGRAHILRIHSRNMNVTRTVDLDEIATQLRGASGADCKAVCTEAGMFALREQRVHVTQHDFELAAQKVMRKDLWEDVSKFYLVK